MSKGIDFYYKLLESILHLSNSTSLFENKISQILCSLSETFQMDQCLLIRAEDILPDGFFSHLSLDKTPIWVEEEISFHDGSVLPEEKGYLRPTFACIPINDGMSFRGILYLGFSKPYQFSSEEKDFFLLIGEIVGAMIRNDDLLRRSEETISELTALYEVGKTVPSTLQLGTLFELILSTGLKMLKAKGGVLRLEDRRTGELRVKSSIGDYHQNPIDEKIAKRVWYTRTPMVFNHSGEEVSSLSILCAPIISKGKAFGTLTFYDKDSVISKFGERDLHLLMMMVNQVSFAVENALIHYEISELASKHEKRVKELSTLWELNKALLTTVNLDRILHLTLTAITIGEGLKFNRAMLFLVNEKDHLLQGAMAVGPNSIEEAAEIWASLSQRKEPLSELIVNLSPQNDSLLNSLVKEIQVPLDQEQCILSRTVLEGKPFNIRFPLSEEGWIPTPCESGCRLVSEVGCSVSKRLSHDPKVHSFATVPLRGKRKVIGVILVDNLYNQHPITEEDLHFLYMFTNQAGLAIENAILYRNLEEVHQELKETQNFSIHLEKMAALGEMSATIAHEIKNPLTSIGGFTRRLDRTLPEGSQEKKYSQTIIKEVSRLEKILDDLLTYTHDEAFIFKELDLREILDENLSWVKGQRLFGGIELIKEYSENSYKVRGNAHQLKQAFYHLIQNAYQAMEGKGMLCVRVYPHSKNGSQYMRVEIEDTGRGINPAEIHHIFNPFFSTRDSRLGLGLPIVHRIITSHQGRIEVDNYPGKGAKFIVTLPVPDEGF